MWMVVVGGLLITLPAIVTVGYFVGTTMVFPAIASLFMAALPFFAFAYVLRRASDE